MGSDRSVGGANDFSLRLAWDEEDDRAPAVHAVDDPADETDAPSDPDGLADAISALRDDVTGLRHAVLEWPDLEQLAQDVAQQRQELAAELVALRDDVSALVEASRVPPRPPALLPLLAPLLEEVGSLREEVVALRRRIALRAGSGPTLDDAQLAQLADLVAARVLHARTKGR